MKNILNLLKNPTLQKIVMIVTIFILSVFIFKDCGRTTTDDAVTKLEQNIAYYKDSLIIQKNKNKDIEYSRAVLAATNKNLESLNSDIKKEIEKEKGKVIYLSKLNTKLVDSLNHINSKNGNVDVRLNSDGSTTISWSYDTTYSEGNFHGISGNVKMFFVNDTIRTITENGSLINIISPKIDKKSIEVNIPVDEMHIALITGLQRNKETNNLEIFVRSDYPGFNVTKIDGAIIDPQKDALIKSYFPRKRFVIGPQIGAGISTNLKPSIFIGIGLTYKIFEF